MDHQSTYLKDITWQICQYFVCDIDKINFLSCTKLMHLCKNNILYHDRMDIKKIQKLFYFNQFIDILIQSNDVSFYFENEDEYLLRIPKNMKYLTYGENFNQNINGYTLQFVVM